MLFDDLGMACDSSLHEGLQSNCQSGAGTLQVSARLQFIWPGFTWIPVTACAFHLVCKGSKPWCMHNIAQVSALEMNIVELWEPALRRLCIHYPGLVKQAATKECFMKIALDSAWQLHA